jgi:hypothetical protein
MPGNEDVPLEEEVLSYLREVESVIFVIDINVRLPYKLTLTLFI